MRNGDEGGVLYMVKNIGQLILDIGRSIFTLDKEDPKTRQGMFRVGLSAIIMLIGILFANTTLILGIAFLLAITLQVLTVWKNGKNKDWLLVMISTAMLVLSLIIVTVEPVGRFIQTIALW